MSIIAGKVAPRFMGEYNKDTIYQFYDAVINKNKLYFCKKSGTVGIEPNKTDDNWFLSIDGTFVDAVSLGGKTAADWNNEIAVERARIDNLIALEEGSEVTDVEKEVSDLKVGADGVTYASAGTAVRTQFANVKSDLSNITDGGFFGVEIDYIDGGYINETTGEVVAYENWKYTDFIDISERENNTIYLMTNGSRSVSNALFDENKVWLCGRADNVGIMDDTYIPSNAKYIRLSCRSTAEQTLKVYKTKRVTMAELEAVKNASPINSYFKVASYNVGIFNNGMAGVETESAIDKMNEFRKIIGFIDADVLNAQEFKEYFDTGSVYPSLDAVTFKYGYNTKSVNEKNSVSFSKYPITNAVKKNFDSGSGKYYIAFEITVDNKVITIINAHLSIEEDASIYRNSEIAELITFMNTKVHVILTGDMNASSQSEYDAYKTAGYKVCNGGDFGWFSTWPVKENMPSDWATSWPCENLDNIIVSSNIVPQYVETIECGISDHAPLVATLRID